MIVTDDMARAWRGLALLLGYVMQRHGNAADSHWRAMSVLAIEATL